MNLSLFINRDSEEILNKKIERFREYNIGIALKQIMAETIFLENYDNKYDYNYGYGDSDHIDTIGLYFELHHRENNYSRTIEIQYVDGYYLEKILTLIFSRLSSEFSDIEFMDAAEQVKLIVDQERESSSTS